MSSVFSPRDFALIDPLVSRHKIASYEINYQELITLVAHSKKPLILSTGASCVTDIDWAVSLFQEEGGGDLTLLQCTAKYPAHPAIMNLEVIPWLKARYEVKSGLSDHSLDPLQAPLAAVALGATCIEKHFTLSRKLLGPDHGFALEPQELKSMITSIRAVEKMKGSPYKNILESEKELYLFCRRGIQALHDIRPGEILEINKNIAVLRPGKRSVGLHPKYLSQVNGKKALSLIKKGEGIQFLHLEKR
jgi:N-acetylneuraminate synthase